MCNVNNSICNHKYWNQKIYFLHATIWNEMMSLFFTYDKHKFHIQYERLNVIYSQFETINQMNTN